MHDAVSRETSVRTGRADIADNDEASTKDATERSEVLVLPWPASRSGMGEHQGSMMLH
jgi:hypothetical protein